MYSMTEKERADLRLFVERVVEVEGLPRIYLEKLDKGTLDKSELTQIQERIDKIIKGFSPFDLVSDKRVPILIEIHTCAARAHKALSHIQVYDWKI